MIIDWLYKTTLETSLLIGLVLLLRPIVKRTLGAKVTYGLWVIPLLRVVLPERPERNNSLFESIGLPTEQLSVEYIPIPELNSSISTFPWDLVWLTGLAIWLSLRIVSWVRFQHALKTESKDFTLPKSLEAQIASRVKLRFHKIGTFICKSPSAPFVTGLLQPAIYLPPNFLIKFSQQEQVWVLIHELTHIQRRDLWVQCFGEIVRAVFWFNPVIHYAVQVLQEDQELACDSSILAHCNSEERYQYGKTLLIGSGPHLTPSVLTFFSKSKERFTMLSKHKVSTINTIVGIGLCAVVSLFALTKAPQSIAQLAEEVEYDANSPVLLKGVITNVELFETHSFYYIDAINKITGETEAWVVDGGAGPDMVKAGLTEDLIGKEVMMRGYQTIDKNCVPLCRMNGHDIKLIDG